MSEPSNNPSVQHERSDVNVRAILAFGAALLIITAIVSVSMAFLFGYFSRQVAEAPRMFPLAADSQRLLPPEPRLQTTPRQDLLELRAREDAMLRTYGWVDKGAGIARIPVEEAMKITIQRGFPARETKQ
jgi:hypothetical protein